VTLKKADLRFAGKVALVAGGAGGIGAATCRMLAEEGAEIVCADINEQRGNEFEAHCRDAGLKLRFQYLDAGDPRGWTNVVSSLADRSGGLDVLVTAIYSGPAGSVLDLTPKDWTANFRVTSTGVFLAMRTCAPLMRAPGAIVNVSSVAAHGGAAKNMGYSAAKASVLAMSRAAAAEFAPQNIRVNVVTPGFVQTPAFDKTMEALKKRGGSASEIRARYLRRVPLGRIGQPDEIAKTILFLASDDASYITGAEVIVDGGLRTA
jgi:NAD(P)-dependent dehydrogenase (short-subunit alcohol dehydrogenase family)